MRGIRTRTLRLALAWLAVSALLGSLTAVASAAVARARVGSTPALPGGAKVAGAAPGSQPLQLTVVMRSPDPSGLAALATEVSTPGTPLFRHYLSVSQFAQQFGATALQIGAVESTLRAQGLRVGTITANHLTIPVTGTAAQAEKAFAVGINRVTLSGGRVAYANAQVPTLASNIAPYVQGVLGLDDVNPDQPAGVTPGGHGSAGASLPLARAAARPHVATGGPQPTCPGALGQQSNHGLTADEVATAYQFSSLYGAGDFGAGQTVALFEEQPYIPSDIATYQACYGTNTSVSNVDVAGGPGASGDDGESALDIEQVIGLAPAAKILVYQGPYSATVQIMSKIVSDDLAKVISSSYGLCEALTGSTQINAESPLLQEAALQGQSFYISSGDSGSNMCYQATRDQPQPDFSLSVIDPGGQPFATGVGGTSLIATSGGTEAFYVPGETPLETVWNDVPGTDPAGNPQASGSGGGISSFFTMPSYQSGAAPSVGVTNPNSSGTPCGSASACREVPDVSANADPNTGYAIFSSTGGQGAWGITGGTSAAAPLWAAFTALANASSRCRGIPVGFVNPALYQLAGSSYGSDFSDVSTASPNSPGLGFSGQANNDALYQYNITQNPNDLFPVTAGYDMATGLGSMIAPALAGSLCSLASPQYAVTVSGPGPQVGKVGRRVLLAIHGSDAGGAPLAYSAGGLPAGLHINAGNGVISGTPTTPGNSTVTVLAFDRFKNAGATRFNWAITRVAGKPRTTGAKLQGVAQGKPRLSFSAAAGSGAPALKSVSIGLPNGLSFTHRAKSLAKGIVVKAGSRRLKFKLRLSHGTLTISLRKPAGRVTVTIAPPAIGVSHGLRSKVLHHNVKLLGVTIRVAGIANQTTRFSLKLKV